MSAEGGNGFADSGNGCGGSVDGFEGRPSGQHTASDGSAGGGGDQPAPGSSQALAAEAQRAALESFETVESLSGDHVFVRARFGDQARWIRMGRGDSVSGSGWSCSGVASVSSSPGDTDV